MKLFVVASASLIFFSLRASSSCERGNLPGPTNRSTCFFNNKQSLLLIFPLKQLTLKILDKLEYMFYNIICCIFSCSLIIKHPCQKNLPNIRYSNSNIFLERISNIPFTSRRTEYNLNRSLHHFSSMIMRAALRPPAITLPTPPPLSPCAPTK